MSSNLTLVNESGLELESLNLGYIPHGKYYEKKIGIKNNSANTVDYILFCPWPGIKNNGVGINKVGNPVHSASIIRRNSIGENQVTVIAKEDEGAACPQNTSRGKIFLWTGTQFEDYSSSNSIPLPANSSQILYIGYDWYNKNTLFNFDTSGEYTGLTFKYSSSTSAFTDLPVDFTDGTAGTTQNGVLNYGTLTEAMWKKQVVNSYSMLWLKVTVDTVTTPAVASEIRHEYVYDLPASGFLGDVSLYKKAGEFYTLIEEGITKKFLNLGRVMFDASPLGEGESLAVEGSYKNPPTNVYSLTFPSETSVSVNSGTPVTIVPDGEAECLDAILGMVLIFNTVTVSDEAEIVISPSVKYLNYALVVDGVPGDYQNQDIDLGSIAPSAITYFYIKATPPSDESQTNNLFYFENFAYGD